jgi:YfiR/HmsC-like
LIANEYMKRSLPTKRSRPGRIEGIRTTRPLAIALLCWLAIPAGIAQPHKPTEYDVEAAYLLNFGKFVRQGQPPRSSFDICLVGHDSMGPTIDKLAANQAIDNRPVHVRRLKDVTQARSCEIVYFSPSENDRLREDLALLPSPDALTVCDASDFLDRGGMIQFLLIDKHVRFTVNLSAVNHAHLLLSSELLRVALSVTGKPSGEQP